MTDFIPRLRTAQAERRSALCVGLDPDPARLPRHLLARHALPDAVVAFNAAVIEATAPAACAYKLNFAFYEALGRDGYGVLERTVQHLPPDALAVADAKRGDIGNTARFYAEALFEQLGFDACTVAPYMGRDAVRPFLDYAGRCAFVLARTSNPSAADFQEQHVGEERLYERVARHVAQWDGEAPGTAGLVVGATSGDALGALRRRCPTLPFLIPGIGAQGGDPAALAAAATADGLVLVNSSRSILYASGGEDFAEAAGASAESLRQTLEHALQRP
ncbi:MAG: orotidine-5'-phosphate decarboxylase [Rhodothermales bacterium]|nr:orotidine-5'-phosphate decarboxylase [Rhodothermales bacterium]